MTTRPLPPRGSPSFSTAQGLFRSVLAVPWPEADAYHWRPPANVLETEDGIEVQLEVAGLAREDFRVRLEGRRLIIDGTRRPPRPSRSCVACHRVEIAGGRFRTEVELPWPVQAEALAVDYRDGFLFLSLPRRRA